MLNSVINLILIALIYTSQATRGQTQIDYRCALRGFCFCARMTIRARLTSPTNSTCKHTTKRTKPKHKKTTENHIYNAINNTANQVYLIDNPLTIHYMWYLYSIANSLTIRPLTSTNHLLI